MMLKSCQSNFISFYDRVISLVGQGNAVDNVSQSILINKMIKYGFDS